MVPFFHPWVYFFLFIIIVLHPKFKCLIIIHLQHGFLLFTFHVIQPCFFIACTIIVLQLRFLLITINVLQPMLLLLQVIIFQPWFLLIIDYACRFWRGWNDNHNFLNCHKVFECIDWSWLWRERHEMIHKNEKSLRIPTICEKKKGWCKQGEGCRNTYKEERRICPIRIAILWPTS
jgi:hypothetical protein